MADTILLRAVKSNPSSLKLSSKNLTTIPSIIGELQSLRELDAKGNRLTALPKEITRLKSLVKLNVGNNNLHELPEELRSLELLERLHLFGNHITAIEANAFERLSCLRLLNLNDNNLTSLPLSLSRLKRLEYLSVDSNQIEGLPDELCSLTNLRVLHCANNSIRCLPHGIGQLSLLKKLFCQKNLLEEIPDSLCECRSLEVLDVSANRIRIFPENFLCLQVNELHCEKNNLYNCEPVCSIQQDEVLPLKEAAGRVALKQRLSSMSSAEQSTTNAALLLVDHGTCAVCNGPYLNTWLNCVEFVVYKKSKQRGGAAMKIPIQGRLCSYKCFNAHSHCFYGIAGVP